MAVQSISESCEPFSPTSDGSKVLIDALEIVNKKFEEKVVFIDQPNQPKGAPFDPKNICKLALEGGRPLGGVNVVIWREGLYDYEKKERIIERFCTPQELAETIEQMVRDHASSQKGVLETASGTRFDVTHLKKNTLIIDEEGYFRLNGLRLWTIVWENDHKPLLAEKLMSDKVLTLKEFEGRITILEEGDPAPAFFIDTSKVFTPDSEKEMFYLFCRDWDQSLKHN